MPGRNLRLLLATSATELFWHSPSYRQVLSLLTLKVTLTRTSATDMHPVITFSAWVSDTHQERFVCSESMPLGTLLYSQNLVGICEHTIVSLLRTASSILKAYSTVSEQYGFGSIQCSLPTVSTSDEESTASSITPSSFWEPPVTTTRSRGT